MNATKELALEKPLKDYKQPKKWFKNMDVGVKDMLCDIYEYIQRWENSEDYNGIAPNFDTVFGVHIGMRGTKYHDLAWKDEALGRFMAHLDDIKELVEKRPEVKVVYWSFYDPKPDSDEQFTGQRCSIKEYRTFRDYNEGETSYLLGIINSRWNATIIHQKNSKFDRPKKNSLKTLIFKNLLLYLY